MAPPLEDSLETAAAEYGGADSYGGIFVYLCNTFAAQTALVTRKLLDTIQDTYKEPEWQIASVCSGKSDKIGML